MRQSIDLNIIEQYVNDGRLRVQSHPTLPLLIYNYTEETQYNKLWDEITLQCRGLVLDHDGNIVAKPFPKFFNIEEACHTPTNQFEVFDKVDGSLGIVFLYNGELVVATRGSFQSVQAEIGLGMIKSSPTCYHNFIEGYTYLYEIVYPANRVVVDYKCSLMILLGAYDDNHDELPYSELFKYDTCVVKRFDGIDDYTTLRDKFKYDSMREGFVIRFSNGSRCKAKYEDYVRLHKIMTNVSTISIYECLKNNTKIDLNGIPDELFSQIKEYENTLTSQYEKIENEAKEIYAAINHIKNRRKFAEQVISLRDQRLHPIIFRMADEKDYSELIWKHLRPEFKKI